MSKVVKIAISLPAELCEAADQMRQKRGETRSEFFRNAVALFLRSEQEQEAIERYIQGYHQHPETDDDIAAIHQVSVEVLSQEPWD